MQRNVVSTLCERVCREELSERTDGQATAHYPMMGTCKTPDSVSRG